MEHFEASSYEVRGSVCGHSVEERNTINGCNYVLTANSAVVLNVPQLFIVKEKVPAVKVVIYIEFINKAQRISHYKKCWWIG